MTKDRKFLEKLADRFHLDHDERALLMNAAIASVSEEHDVLYMEFAKNLEEYPKVLEALGVWGNEWVPLRILEALRKGRQQQSP